MIAEEIIFRTPALIQKTAKEYLRKTNRTVVVLITEKSAAARGGVIGQLENRHYNELTGDCLDTYVQKLAVITPADVTAKIIKKP